MNILPEKRSAEWFWSTGLTIFGVGLGGVGGLVLAVNPYLQALVKDYLIAPGLASDTSLKLISSFPNELIILGLLIIVVAQGQKLLLRGEDFLIKLHHKAGENKVVCCLKERPFIPVFFLLFFSIALLYHNLLDIYFFKDDFGNILFALRGPWHFVFRQSVYFWRPLGMLYFRWVYYFFKADPTAYHTISILVHILNASLVYWVVQKIFANRVLSLLTSIIFATRYALFFALAWISVTDTIATVFMLLSLVSYLEIKKSRLYLVVSAVFFAMALMSKEITITLPGILLAYELILNNPGFDWRKIKNIIGRLMLHFAVVAGYCVVRYTPRSFLQFPDHGMYQLRFDFMPINNIINYTRFSFNGAADTCTIMVVILLAFCLFNLNNKQGLFENIKKEHAKGLIFGVCWLYIAISPVLIIGELSKYYLYMPIIGFSLAMAWLAERFYRKIQVSHAVLANAFIVIFLFATVFYSFIKIDGVAYADEWFLEIAQAAKNQGEDIRRMYPEMPTGAKLYFVPKDKFKPLQDKTLDQFYMDTTDHGKMFKLFYRDESLQTKHISKEQLKTLQLDEKSFVFAFDDKHLYDITESLREN